MAKKAAADKGLDKIALKQGALSRLRIEYVPLDSIKPNKYNPNRQDDKEFRMLQESMTEDGFTVPIVVQRATHEIVDGEHRWRAARALKLSAVPVVFVDMTDEQMRISTLRHNRARGAEDQDLAIQVLKDLQELGALGWAQGALGMSDDELNVLINDVSVADALASDEHTEAWQPVKNLIEGEGKSDVSMHADVQAMNARLNAKLAEAKTSGEKQAIESERRASTYRLSVVLSPEDGSFVRKVLGDKPVERLLALATAWEKANAA